MFALLSRGVGDLVVFIARRMTCSRNVCQLAISCSESLSTAKKVKVKGLKPLHRVTKGVFEPNVNGQLQDIDIEKKIDVTREAEAEARKYSEHIKSAYSSYLEILDHKIIVNSDGAEFETFDSKPEFSITCIANPEVIASQRQKEEVLPVDGGTCFKLVTIYSMPDWLLKEP